MRSTVLSLTILAGVCSSTLAQQTLYLESEQNVELLCDLPNNPNFFVGNNVSAIALSGDNLFIGGYNNTGVAQNTRLVKIENIFGVRAFRLLNLNSDPLGTPIFDQNFPPFRGVYGMTYATGQGLLTCFDGGGVGVAGAFRFFDVDTQLNPILVSSSPAGLSPRGGAGPAFDFGFNGQGFDLNGDSVLDGPVMGLLDFASYPGGVQAKGPFGVRLRESSLGANNQLTAIGTGRIYDGNSVDGLGVPTAPVLNATDINGNRVQGTLWRDISIHPQNGNIAARASNDVVIGIRNSSNGLSSLQIVDLSGPGPADNYAFQILQRCEILNGFPGGDLIVYNDYSAAASTVTGWTRFVDFSGQSATVNLLNADGSPFAPANPNGILDYAWDAANGRLAINNFAGRRVYIFTTTPPTPACAWQADGCFADYNNDGGIDGDDVIAFFGDWDNATDCADADASLGVDGDDVILFFSAWDVSGAGFTGCE